MPTDNKVEQDDDGRKFKGSVARRRREVLFDSLEGEARLADWWSQDWSKRVRRRLGALTAHRRIPSNASSTILPNVQLIAVLRTVSML